MLRRCRTALKYMTYGLLVGIFFAPDSGANTRRRVTNWVSSGFQEIVGNATGNNSQ